MKTNKLFLVCMTAVALFTACSNDEIGELAQEKKAISFDTQGGMPAFRTTTTTTNKVDAFVVYGTDDKTWGSGNTLLFNGVTVARTVDNNGSSTKFAYSPLKYYPEDANESFWFAFSPVSSLGTTMTNLTTANYWTNGLSFTYTVPKKDPLGKTTQDDFLVATPKKMPADQNIHLDFEHALTRMFVYASNMIQDIITIKEITLTNLCSKGTFRLYATGDWDWAVDAGSKTDYAYLLPETGVTLPNDEGRMMRRLINARDQGMMVMPQTLIAGKFGIKVTYVIGTGTERTKEFVFTDEMTIAAGTQYGINIVFEGISNITFNINVEDWAAFECTETGDDLYIWGIN
jgi:hypothetical protein